MYKRQVLQRTYEHASSNILTIHDIALDISKSTLTWKGNSIDLTKNELRIMHCLFQNKNKIVSRNELMQHMWDCDLFVDDNTLTVNINRLRKKLEYLRLDDLIQTKRGMEMCIRDRAWTGYDPDCAPMPPYPAPPYPPD